MRWANCLVSRVQEGFPGTSSRTDSVAAAQPLAPASEGTPGEGPAGQESGRGD